MDKMVQDKVFRDKARGMLVGLTVGDALGAPVEFLPSPSDVYIEELGEEIEYFHDNLRLPAGAYTDDTAMALCLADSLLEKGGYDSYDVMERYAKWMNEGYRTYDSRPADDVGNQTRRAIEEFLKEPEVCLENMRTEAAGNGAIMRLAPVVLAGKNIKDIVKMAELSCLETHNSVAAGAVTEMFATCLYLALQGNSKSKILDGCDKFISSQEYKYFAEETKEDILAQIQDKDGYLLRDLGGYIVDAFAISLWGLIHFENFRDGMLAVIRLGGDTDTNGAIYGQLAGAYYGYSKIPKEWREEVMLATELVEIADKLAKLNKCPILKSRFL